MARVPTVLVVMALVVALTACAGGGAVAAVAPPGAAAIVRVVDGDTVIVRLGGGEERVRLIGINTPESVDPRRPVECFGKEASRFTGALLPPGTAVRLVRDAEPRDDYGRLLAYVYRGADGLFVNLELARQGYADVLTIPPNVAHAAEFVRAARDARTAHRGLWAACSDTVKA